MQTFRQASSLKRHGDSRHACVPSFLCTVLVVNLFFEFHIDLSSFHAPNALRTSHWDSLEKALTVFRLPPNEKSPEQNRVRRRLDLIFAAPETYWTAVIG